MNEQAPTTPSAQTGQAVSNPVGQTVSNHQAPSAADPQDLEALSMLEKAEKDLGIAPAAPASAPAQTPETPKTGEQPPDAEAKPKPPTDKPGEKPPTEPSKYEKEKRRQQTQWDRIKAEKEALARERADVEAARARSEARHREAEAQSQRFTRADYQQAAALYKQQAQELEDAGQFEQADEKRNLAKLAEKAAAETPEAVQDRPANGADAFAAEMEQSWDRVKTEVPAVLQRGSTLNRCVLDLVKQHPEVLKFTPQAPYIIARCADAVLASAGIPALEAAKAKLVQENDGLKQKVAELEALVTPGVPGGQVITAPRRFEDLSLAEQEAQVRAEAQSIST